MKTEQIDNQTSFELQDGEEVIFSNMPGLSLTDFKNKKALVGKDHRYGNIAVTNKRVVFVPFPNKKNYQTESFYYSDINSVFVPEGFDNFVAAWLDIELKTGACKRLRIGLKITAWTALKSAIYAMIHTDTGVSVSETLSYNTHSHAMSNASSRADADRIQASYDNSISEIRRQSARKVDLEDSGSYGEAHNFLGKLIINELEYLER